MIAMLHSSPQAAAEPASVKTEPHDAVAGVVRWQELVRGAL